MVVFAAAIITKSGKPLVSRQFVEMSRIRVEGLLSAFPKLVGTGKQHTYVETDNIRYVFQPMEGLYLLLLTNRQSNILDDLDTLRLLSKIVPEYASPMDEEGVGRSAFELIFAFDEVISMGLKENVRVQQVKQNIEMESTEEKIHKMIIESKIKETREKMREHASKLDRERAEKAKLDRAGGGGGGTGQFVSHLQSTVESAISSSLGTGESDYAPSYRRPTTGLDLGSRDRDDRTSKGGRRGMQLGKGRRGNEFIEALRAEGEVVQEPAAGRAGAAAAAAAAPPGEPVSISIEEKISATLNRDGGIEMLEVQGVVTLQVNAEEASKLVVGLATGANRGFQFKTHPNIDKNLHASEGRLALKDPERPFPVGTALGVLKWRWSSRDDDRLPLIINCWPSASGNETYVNMDYEATEGFDLQGVAIAIPLPSDRQPAVNQCDGDWQWVSRKNVLMWNIDLIDASNRNGALEFVVQSPDADDIFPVDVTFTAASTLCDISIESVEDSSTGAAIKYGCKKALTTGDYQVV
ncbi:unnamed protein product [Ostreobium quekettii]|uniref:Coatomer subunit delta n=1 Tax=Ostreobium quekettii TaxID=121088 RepID=A0A8S1J787_9CHLO|nr:unnamed protein product [Ostreobium quekettii]|eukprot:evm.model.scf_177.3 EVM.evm.TU.scf_177.3   scf_177:11432-16516(+)